MEFRTIRADQPAALPAALSEIRSSGFTGSLALVFTSVALARQQIGRSFTEAGFDVFGATTAGEIHVEEEDCVFDDSIVAAVLDPEPDSYALRLFESGAHSDYELGIEVGSWAKDRFAHPAILMMSAGLSTDGEQILNGIQSRTGEDAPIFGGMAGDGQRFAETYVFSDGATCGKGVLALVFDGDRVEMRGMAASGWQPLGVEKIVTSSEGNVVHTIDDVPALDLYREYLGLTSTGATGQAMALGEAPLQIVRDGYTVLRAAMIADPEGRSMTFAGTVPEGSRVRFSTSPGPEIAAASLEAMRRLHEGGAEADGLIMFSCAARRFSLGPMAEDEIRPIQELWRAPLVGLFTYGEIGSVGARRSDFHNETCVLVTLRER
jgi:hypothetical protein